MVSILDSIKQMLGISSDDTDFDIELVMHINGALMVMTQLGVGPIEGYSIQNKDNTWTEFLQDRTDLNLVLSDVYLRVKLIFDPPQNSFLVTAIERQIQESDSRIEAWHQPKMSNAETYVSIDEDTDEEDFYDCYDPLAY